jgi:cell division septal protein FtsQ
MATYTPPPYFPQGSLAPPDENRYKKFRVLLALAVIVILLLLGGFGVGIWYLMKWLF